MYNTDTIRETLLKALPGAIVQIVDMTGTKDHFEATVIWKGFENKSLLEQHQTVMQLLKEGLKESIHALAIKTFTPEKWEQKRSTK